MDCPVDGATLLMTERNGIEIDYCPECRGVWLDRGELDKLIERADRFGPADRDSDRGRPPRGSDRKYYEHDHHDRDHRYGYDPRQFKRKKKSSFLSEIFEFGD